MRNPAGNTEGTPESRDSVESVRETSVQTQDVTDSRFCYYCKVVVHSPLGLLLHQELRERQISFATERRLLKRYFADILLLAQPVVIEADEDYHKVMVWQRAKDAERDSALAAAGYRIFRFGERDICRDPAGCVNLVISECGLAPEVSPAFQYAAREMSGPGSASWRGGKPAWTCATCGKHFHAYLRNGRPRMTCSYECNRIWQSASGASVKDRRSNGDAMRKLWADPEWRIKQASLIREARWPAGR